MVLLGCSGYDEISISLIAPGIWLWGIDLSRKISCSKVLLYFSSFHYIQLVVWTSINCTYYRGKIFPCLYDGVCKLVLKA